MTQPQVQIPSEVWNHVFGYLTAGDKFNVRTSCKYFKKLIDHWSLWKDWTVVLSFRNGAYNAKFWATLRRRRVKSAVMRSTKAKDWKDLAMSLPTLTTIVIEQSIKAALSFLNYFPHLKRLAVRSADLLFDTSSMSRPQQLTHLSICCGNGSTTSKGKILNAVCQFTNLISLTWHDLSFGVLFWTMQTLLSRLPKLKHLSLSMKHAFHDSGRDVTGNGRVSGLSSLELVNYSYHSLPEDVMKLIPCLNSLAVFYNHSHQELHQGRSLHVPHLKTWLRELPQLSTLVVVKGPPVSTYVSSIPATVTSLTLCVAGLSSEDMAAIAVQVPNLLHLHIDAWPSHLGAGVAQMPQLFPKLRSLKLRHEHVPEKDFLCLHKLQDLEYLEVLDNQQPGPDLAVKLRVLAKHRLHVATSPRQRDVLFCPCVSQVY